MGLVGAYVCNQKNSLDKSFAHIVEPPKAYVSINAGQKNHRIKISPMRAEDENG